MQRAASLPAILAALLLACPAPALAGQCSAKGHRLWGKVKVVNAHADLKVQVVNSFPDKCGKWQMVNTFPDFTIQFVNSFPDVKIQYVNSFPGMAR
jgi:hypothetical protein